MEVPVSAAVRPVGQTSPHKSSGGNSCSSLSVCLHRYLRWLQELCRTVDAVSDDAYTLDRLVRQGVLPLRQRTGITATNTEAQLRASVCTLLIGDAAVQPGRPGANMWASSTANSRNRYTPTGVKKASPSPSIAHTDSPFCPCLSYYERQQREAESRRIPQRQSSEDDESDESHAEHAAIIDSGSSSDDDGSDRAARLSRTVSHFKARLKDALHGIEHVSGRTSVPLAHTVTLGHSGGNSSSSRSVSLREGNTVLGSRPSGSTPSHKVYLLPVAAATHHSATSTESESDTSHVKVEVSASQPQHSSPEGSVSSASSPFQPFPVPVGADTQAYRTLHPMLAHVSPDDVRRCSLCSAQLLLESAWHAIYQMNLLTLLSAAPSMAAPLPLPPPDILRIHPTEALLLLYHCTQRCFVSGIVMATTVGAPTLSNKKGPSSTNGDKAPKVLSALDVLRGGHGDGAATETYPTVQQQQQQATEERVLGGLAGGLLCIAGSVTGTAAAQLWPREATAALVNVVVSDIVGDILTVRFELFNTLFVLFTTQNSSCVALEKLVVACDGLRTCLQRLLLLRQRSAVPAEASSHLPPVTQTSVGDVHLPESSGAVMTTENKAMEEATNAATAKKDTAANFCISHSLDAARHTLTQAFVLLGIPHPIPGAAGETSSDDTVAVVMDDIRALCCIAALLGLFAGLVYTHEMSASTAARASVPAAEPASPPSPLSMSPPLASLPLYNCLLLDCHVYPCLQRLQSSTRGDCSAQARHLVALWWLLRAETVRHWAWFAEGFSSHEPNNSAVLMVLDVCITLSENVELETQPAQGQQCQHWSQWLKDSSRAVVRASDVASEFLGLTLIPEWSTAASPTPQPTVSVASRSTPLRSQLPAFSVSPLSSPTHITLLPLPWIRLWLLLCPPLFRASPADVVALRQQVQDQRERDGASPAMAGSDVGGRGTPHPTAGQEAVTTKDKGPRQVRQVPAGNTGQSRTRAQSKTKKPVATMAARSVDVKPPRVSPSRRETVTSVTAAPYDKQAREAQLQWRLQKSKESMCFWLRWCLLFMPSPPGQSNTTDSGEVSSSPSTLLLSALENVVTRLHFPKTAWVQGPQHSAVSSTEAVLLLQRAFPIHTPRNLVSSLTAQAQQLLASGADLRAVSEAKHEAETTPPPTHETSGGVAFAPYSFTAALGDLRHAVEHPKHGKAAAMPIPLVTNKTITQR